MRKKSLNVYNPNLYSGRATNNPDKNKHKAAPKGSSMTPRNPLPIKAEEAPSTVSEPNHVANSAQATMNIGKRRPATTKSAAECTRRDAHQPTASVPAKYKPIKHNKTGCAMTKRMHLTPNIQPSTKKNAQLKSGLLFTAHCVLRTGIEPVFHP